MGIQDLIKKKVPSGAIFEKKEKKHAFEKVSPLELIKHLHDNTESVDCFNLKELVKAQEVNIDFEGTKLLKEHFKELNEIIKALQDDHDISAFYSLLMADYLLQIQKQGGEIFCTHMQRL